MAAIDKYLPMNRIGARAVLGVALGALTLSFTGCALVLGIEKRTEEEPLEGVLDQETGIRTIELCVNYCNAVIANCEDEHAVYASRASCINTCNALPPGLSSEPLGNTVECRLRRANSAASAPEEFCVSAGPGGGGSCGSNCEAWCGILENVCPADFETLENCQRTCATIPDDGGFDVDGSYQKDDIQCRLIHLGAAADDPIHCEHGRFVPAAQCLPGQEGEPTCDRYCDVVMEICDGQNAVYESRAQCLAACSSLTPGDLSDSSENTVGCRLYHGTAAAEDAAFHCDHAGPTGDGMCGANQSGNCDSYCQLFQAACETAFEDAFSGVEECSEACRTSLSDDGAGAASEYTVLTARDSDSVQCRTYYAVLALAGDETACEKADLAGTCD
jgi:hypothetical protein